MAAICKAAAGPLGLRQAVLAEGTRTLTSPLLGRRRQGATACSWRRSQGRVLALKDQPEPDPTSEGPVMRGDAKRAADDSGPCATVTFKTCRRVPFGQALKVVGGLPQLGDWDCERAPAMTWTEGDQWLLSVQLPAGHHQFKVVQAQSDAAGYNWEGGPNRELSVPLPEAAAHGAFTVVCEWGNTVSSLETLPEEELEMGVALSDEEDDAPLLRAEDLTAEPYSPNGDEDEAPVGAINMKGRPKMGVGADDALLGEPAGGLKPSTEAAVKEELQKQALSGSLGGGKQDKEEDDSDDYGSGGSSGGGGRVSGGAPPPTQQPRSGQQQGSEPPSGLQMAAAAAGLAALPVVGWSEYVLRTTGCGLPPGPGGLLGAAEGVSYLVVGGVVLWSLARKLGTGSGLPAGPAGALGAVEGGSWLAAAAGLGVLVLQWQTFGYIPSALPDANCFGAGAPTAASFSVAQTPGGSVATSQLAPAPALTSSGGIRQAAPAFGAPLRLPAGGPSLPQGNLLFSAAEGVLSQSGTIAQTAETAAAAVAAVLAGQPPPAALAVALQHAQARAVQAQQLASAIVGKLAGDDAQAAQAAELQAPLHTAPQLEPLNLNPPRHKARVEAQQAAQRTAQAKAAAASTSSVKPAAATSSSSKSAQASSTTSSNVKPSAASTGIMPAAASSATSSNFKPTAASSSVKPAAASTTTPSTAASSTTSTSSGPAVPKTALAPQRPKPAAGTVAAPPAASAP
ncbi:hypothetical protein C2E20_1164 isoform B [Micractinium conductrix]|uniref:CBM20 domain-containing protein n=1 Tax=Micractinium conductrix TaxID=554055 RepID=A0A2P6VMA1_9CHLO|nr:hypothetical protein C2E20_1164 isoform B [Micractinium conductrix]|eukprot:PSC75232.1 hypothetical protein C2E20_1164 isoform B [Micractinium conductrix]